MRSSCPRDGECFYCDEEPPRHLLKTWKARKDSQIMGLEVLSVALGAPPPHCSAHLCLAGCGAVGLSTFHDKIRGRDIVIWSDNAGAEHSMRKGLVEAQSHASLPRKVCQDQQSNGITRASATQFGNICCSWEPKLTSCACPQMRTSPTCHQGQLLREV